MGRKPRVDRTPEEKWQIVQEGMKSGNVAATCRRYGIAESLYYRWKDEAQQEEKAALGGAEALRPWKPLALLEFCDSRAMSYTPGTRGRAEKQPFPFQL